MPSENRGNNAFAFKGRRLTVESAADDFDFTVDLTAEPDATQENIDAARTNAFFIVNSVHDLTYM